jgi:hypothetical protein
VLGGMSDLCYLCLSLIMLLSGHRIVLFPCPDLDKSFDAFYLRFFWLMSSLLSI